MPSILVLVALSACSEMMDPFFPSRSILLEHFTDYGPDYERIATHFAEDPMFVEILCDGDYREGRKTEGMPLVQLQDEEDSTYANVCGALNLVYMRKTERGIVFYHLVDERQDTTIVSSFVRLDNTKTDVPNCDPLMTDSESGACDFALEGRWVLNYQWAPTSERETMLD